MAVENIGDDNLADFLANNKAVLVLSLANCGACHKYEPVFEQLSEALTEARFGKTIMTESVIPTLRDSGIIGISIFPTTIVYRMNAPGCYFHGAYEYEDALEIISGILNSEDQLPENYITRIHSFDPNARPNTMQDLKESYPNRLVRFLKKFRFNSLS